MLHHRLAARVLLISPSNRLLLFKIHYRSGALAGMCYWATPGGRLKAGESFEEAAVRELHEETGLKVQSVSQCLARKEFPWVMPDGEHVVAVEHYFVVHAHEQQFEAKGWSDREREVVCEVRWWSEQELLACQEVVFPPDLPSLLAQALKWSLAH
ncbi:NUDIX hydrolase [Pseudomonas promysalinigenes]|uniref:NUDIX hydrolase n=1 Tax=Pseudomonas promysalinigenes TaxID=485898 RepID=UPI003FA0F169